MDRLPVIVGFVILAALLSIGAATYRSPAHAVSFGEQVPDALCPSYAVYLRLGHPPIELADLVCPVA
jgi:hypothetical protein